MAQESKSGSTEIGIGTSFKKRTVLREKVLVLGEATVGKTALLQSFESNGRRYPKSYVMTVGVDLLVKSLKVPDSIYEVEQFFYDVGGQVIFQQTRWGAELWDNANALALVFDYSNKDSFTACSKWLRKVHESRDGRPIPGVLIANKAELRDTERGVVSPKEAAEFAQSIGFQFFEVSAEMNQGVSAPFEHLAREFAMKYEEGLKSVSSLSM